MSHWEPEHLAASERLRLGCFLSRSGFFSSQQQLPEAATTASPVQSGSQRLTWTVARSMDLIMNVGTTAKWSALTGPAKWYWRSHDWPICRIRIFKIVSLVSTCSLDIYFWYSYLLGVYMRGRVEIFESELFRRHCRQSNWQGPGGILGLFWWSDDDHLHSSW